MDSVYDIAYKLIYDGITLDVPRDLNILNYRVYIWTNEYIRGYLNLLNTSKNDHVLTVLGSGDQMNNLLLTDVENIDTIDINPIAEYFALGLKKAAIRKYDLESFINFWHKLKYSNPYTESKLLLDLVPYMDCKYQPFWENIIMHYYENSPNKKVDLTLLSILGYNLNYDDDSMKIYNKYLDSEEEYNKVKEKQDSIKINYETKSITDIDNEKKYDSILMSNIVDYLYRVYDGITDEGINTFCNNMLNHCNDSGKVLFYYMFGSKHIYALENNRAKLYRFKKENSSVLVLMKK